MALPARIEPVYHEKIWGSTDLSPLYPTASKKIGEVWFQPPADLPILVKFLFTSDRLSVQVHPKDHYARQHENSAGKTEMWYILRADPGAQIALGFREPITRERLREAALSGEIEPLLEWIPVHAGETYFTPAGTVHAIGAGLALCEIQQLSDVTYRLYDYGRPRELHLDKAIDVADLGPHAGASHPQVLPDGHLLLAECPYFRTQLLRVAGCETDRLSRPHLLIVIAGEGRIAGRECRAGEVWLADGAAEFDIEAAHPLQLLRTSIPA